MVVASCRKVDVVNRVAVTREQVRIKGPAGWLEGVCESARGVEPVARAVVCHPHPLYQGTLHNKVAFTLARAAVEAGAETLRFNFRGVGGSQGSYDGGGGELADLHAAEAWLARRRPGVPLWRMGFSFGAAIALRASVDEPCAVLVAVAPPAERFGDYGLAAAAPRAERWMVVQGDADDVVNPQAVIHWAQGQAMPPRLAVLAGAGHFFHGRLQELRAAVLDFLQSGPPAAEAA